MKVNKNFTSMRTVLMNLQMVPPVPYNDGMSSWEERMGAKAKARRDAEGRARFEAIVAERKAVEPWRYVSTPPDDGECRECNEWRLWPPGDEQWGYAWWPTCHDMDAPDRWACLLSHTHHDNEVWLAAG